MGILSRFFTAKLNAITLPQALLAALFFLSLVAVSIWLPPLFPKRAEALPNIAKVSLEKETLSINFTFSPESLDRAGEFSQRLNIDQSWQQGISLKLNQEMTQNLKELFPNLEEGRVLEIEFALKNDGIVFEQHKSALLLSPSLGQSLLKGQNLAVGFSLESENPQELIAQAVAAKEATISSELTEGSFWQLLSKLAKIKVSLQDQVLKGEITIK